MTIGYRQLRYVTHFPQRRDQLFCIILLAQMASIISQVSDGWPFNLLACCAICLLHAGSGSCVFLLEWTPICFLAPIRFLASS